MTASENEAKGNIKQRGGMYKRNLSEQSSVRDLIRRLVFSLPLNNFFSPSSCFRLKMRENCRTTTSNWRVLGGILCTARFLVGIQYVMCCTNIYYPIFVLWIMAKHDEREKEQEIKSFESENFLFSSTKMNIERKINWRNWNLMVLWTRQIKIRSATYLDRVSEFSYVYV